MLRWPLAVYRHPEAVIQRYSIKKVFLEISQNSQENNCASLFFNTVAGLWLWHRCLPVNSVKFLRTPFLWNTSGGCFWTSSQLSILSVKTVSHWLYKTCSQSIHFFKRNITYFSKNMNVTRSLQFQESLSSLAPESNNFTEEQKTYDACVKVSVIRRPQAQQNHGSWPTNKQFQIFNKKKFKSLNWRIFTSLPRKTKSALT